MQESIEKISSTIFLKKGDCPKAALSQMIKGHNIGRHPELNGNLTGSLITMFVAFITFSILASDPVKDKHSALWAAFPPISVNIVVIFLL